MVIRDVSADVLGIVEAETPIALEKFSLQLLAKVGGVPRRSRRVAVAGAGEQAEQLGVEDPGRPHSASALAPAGTGSCSAARLSSTPIGSPTSPST